MAGKQTVWIRRVLPIFILMMLAMVFALALVAPAYGTDANGLATQINAMPGLSAAVNGNIVTVTGNATFTATRTFNIDPDVTVRWQANASGALATTNYLIVLSGGGEFEISSCAISNLTGTAGVINITGTGATVTVGDGAEVLSDRAGNAIHIGANDVTLNINTGGTVASLGGSTTAAIQVAVNDRDVKINVNGGIVRSDIGGYAISDGPTTGSGSENTLITVDNEGKVLAGTSTAIRSAGTDSVVIIQSGAVSGSSVNSVTPTINMTAGTGDNVIVNGGKVDNTGTSNTSYTIQTTGNVVVSGGEISTIAGRAINVTDLESSVIVTGGIISATDNGTTAGTAISTATTTPTNVANASVTVSGGCVSATGGNAIRVTGPNSKVYIGGGVVCATSFNNVNTGAATNGNAIYAETLASAGATVIVYGGLVKASDGYAIYNNGSNSRTIVTDTFDGSGGFGGPGGQVAAFHRGPAIYSRGAVIINGGFVFAYGTSASTAVSHINNTGTTTWPTAGSGTGGLVVVWDEGKSSYIQGTPTMPNKDDLYWTAVGVTHPVQWYLNPTLGSGIDYINPPTAGFFPISEVSVLRDYGLIFESATGKMYKDIDGSGSLLANTEEFFVEKGGLWTGVPGELSLNGFTWKTSTPAALTIVGDAKIIISGDNRLQSINDEVVSCGIRSYNDNIVIDGNGALSAFGREECSGSGSYGIDLGSGRLSMSDGTLIAEGTEAAVRCASIYPLPEYFQWTTSVNYDGSDASSGYSPSEPFTYALTDRYVALRVMDPVSFIAAQINGVSGMADSRGIVLNFSQPVSGLTAEDITLINGSGSVTKGGLSGFESVWTIELDSVDAEGSVSVMIGHFGDFYVEPYQQNDVAVYKAIYYDLFINAGFGGAVFGDDPGQYLMTSHIEATARADSGYYFAGWIIEGAEINGGNYANPAVFDMPANPVTLRAVFAAYTPISFTAEQTGGESGMADSTGIEIIFSAEVTGLTIDDITIESDTGVAVAGGLTGSGATYVVSLAVVSVEGDITVSVADFGTFIVTTDARTVTVYKDTHTPATRPAAPVDFVATAGDGQVVLSWTPSSDGGSSVIKYQVSYGPVASGYMPDWIDIPDSWAITTSYIVLGLDNGTEYAFEIRAVNEIGEGESSGARTATPEDTPELYQITFDPNGGAVYPAGDITGPDGRLSELPTPTINGDFIFAGWYDALGGGIEVTTDYVFYSDATIFAMWMDTGGTTGPSGPGEEVIDGPVYIYNQRPPGASASLAQLVAEYDKKCGGDFSITLNSGAYVLRGLSDGRYTLVNGLDYVINGNICVLKARYLKALPVGAQSISFNMSGGENPALTLTVKDTRLRPVTPVDPVNPFADVSATEWFFDDVMYVYHNGVMTGTSASPMLFAPRAMLSRAMIVSILYRQECAHSMQRAASLANPFDDVAGGQWYTDAIKWAADCQIVSGYGDRKYGPDDPVTREQLAAILLRYMRHKDIDAIVPANWIIFADESEISDFGMDATQTFYKLGIISGVGKDDAGRTVIDPKSGATRAQAAAILHRYFRLMATLY